MKVSLIDVDGHNFPNFALMKISAFHKAYGNDVEWYEPLFSKPDVLYASKVFTFTKDYDYFPSSCDVIKGGTGYDVSSRLPDEIESMKPDYSIYPQYDFAIGFLTRGCVNNCPWCVVPRKEGKITVVDDIERIAVRKHVRLMDNNFLASDENFIVEQLEKMILHKYRIDFNQALDCRKVSPMIASLLSKVKWERYIRFSCDTDSQVEPLSRAIHLLQENGYNREIFVYVLSKDIDNSLYRINEVEKLGAIPFCMPYRDLSNSNCKISNDLKRLSNWCNRQAIRKTIDFNNYHTNRRS